MVRYWCVVGVGRPADVGHAVLAAMVGARFHVRALPIGPHRIGIEARWARLSQAFVTPQSVPYLNVVCAPLGLELGTVASSRAFADPSTLDPQIRRLLALGGSSDRARLDELVYRPETAFGQYHTQRCTNFAIVVDTDTPPKPGELDMLRQYDAVIAPTEAFAEHLARLGLSSVHVIHTSDTTSLEDLARKHGSEITIREMDAAPAEAQPLAKLAEPTVWQRVRLRVAHLWIRIRNRLWSRR